MGDFAIMKADPKTNDKQRVCPKMVNTSVARSAPKACAVSPVALNLINASPQNKYANIIELRATAPIWAALKSPITAVSVMPNRGTVRLANMSGNARRQIFFCHGFVARPRRLVI